MPRAFRRAVAQIDDAEIGAVRGIELALGRADDALMGVSPTLMPSANGSILSMTMVVTSASLARDAVL